MQTGGDALNANQSDGRQDARPFTVRRLPGGTSSVSVFGNIDGDRPSTMGRLIADELARGPAQLVLELSRVTSVDSAFVEALVDASAIAGEADTSFALVTSPTGPVAAALVAAGLIERFEIFRTVREARLQR